MDSGIKLRFLVLLPSLVLMMRFQPTLSIPHSEFCYTFTEFSIFTNYAWLWSFDLFDLNFVGSWNGLYKHLYRPQSGNVVCRISTLWRKIANSAWVRCLWCYRGDWTIWTEVYDVMYIIHIWINLPLQTYCYAWESLWLCKWIFWIVE